MGYNGNMSGARFTVLKSPRRRWKMTLRSAPLLEFLLLGQSAEEIRLFRWRWLALAAARLQRSRVPTSFVSSATVEAYVPGANVVPLRRAIPLQDPEA